MAPSRSARREAFAAPLPVTSRSKPAVSRSHPATAPVARITTVSDRQLSDLISSTTDSTIVVLKCFASYCRGCKGVEPKYRKIAAAYEHDQHDEDGRPKVRFCQMDYARNEQFCKEQLGVHTLPFFGIWKDGHYVGGEAMGWQSVGKRLVEKIETAVSTPAVALRTSS